MVQALPEHIGRFRIESLLGRGAMGVVYKGHDPEIDRPVAIKLVRADLLDGEERDRYLDRFRNEAKIAGRCLHANIVGIYDFALFEGNPYLVMEYVDGVPLHQAVPRGTRLPMSRAVQIVLQVLDALDYAHGFGIVHRDIKPANILLPRQGRLKVTDFGISRLLSTDITHTPLMIGTPSYMSPEQCTGDSVDQRSDLFSVGCVLYEILAGQRPFTGANYTDTILKLSSQPHAPLAEARPDLPPELASIVDIALSKAPSGRFSDAASFASALRSVAPPPETVPEGAQAGLDTLAGTRSGGQAALSTLAGTPRADATLALDTALFDTICRRLAQHVGPMARVYVRQSLREAGTPAALCALLSDGIAETQARESFLRDLHGLLHIDTPEAAQNDNIRTSRTDRSAVGPGRRGTLNEGASSNGTAFSLLPDSTIGIPPVPSTQAGAAPAPAGPGQAPETADIERMTVALQQVIGPIATRVVRRAAARAADVAAMEALCLEAMSREEERARFRLLLHGREA